MEQQHSIMFADIAGSTALYDRLGDTEAEKQVSWGMSEMQRIAGRHRGTVIKTIGDEIMACFEHCDDAAEAAIAMQMQISHPRSNPLSLRIGLHYGHTIERDGDRYGDAVNLASRMAGIARALQIITTEDVVNRLGAALKAKCRLFDTTTVKGKDEALNIYQIVWEDQSSVTRLVTSNQLNKIRAGCHAIALTFDNEEKLFSSEDLSHAISIGRDAGCNICLQAAYASRSHLSLQYRRGKFVLQDHSTNGTYIKSSDQPEAFIRREEFVLLGEGCIGLGESCDHATTGILHYSILQSSSQS